MKSLKLTLLTFIIACLAFSCSSDDAPPKSYSELIIGTWKLTALTKDSNNQTLTECSSLDTFTFTDTKFTYLYSTGNKDTPPCTTNTLTGTYSIKEDTMTRLDKSGTSADEIVKLNSTTLVIKYKTSSNNETIVVIETYTRQ